MLALSRARPPTIGVIAAMLLALAVATPAQASAPPRAAGTGATPVTFYVTLKGTPDLGAAQAAVRRADRTRAVYQAKKSHAERAQAKVRTLLAERGVPFTPYWIANAIKVEGTKKLMAELARRPDVAQVLPDRRYRLVEPDRRAPRAGVRAVEWNVDRIGAPQVWSEYGARGQGIVVGTIDTGAQYDHPAIARQYRGYEAGSGTRHHSYSWYDPSGVCGVPSQVPCDNVGHGTHVLGTIVGDDGRGNQTGVAPDARWIAAKGCETNDCSLGNLLAAGQWMVAPTDLGGRDPRPDLAPHVVNNSWGASSPGDPFYRQIVDTWVAAGIFPVFAAGNAGPACGTVNSPADYDASYAVGSFDSGGAIAGDSGRGPGGFAGETKPDIAAPGVGIRSSVPGGGYESWSGTSMATPHVTGTVALLWSAAPALVAAVPDTRGVLDLTAADTADDQCGGTPENNNVWGEGRLDAYQAVTRAPRGPTGALQGTVRFQGVPLPPGQAEIRADGPVRRTAYTEADGRYALRNLPVGEYTVTVRVFGYRTERATVTITEGGTATRDFDLTMAPRHTVSGHVRDDRGAPVAGAEVTVPDTPLPPARTGPDGRYAIGEVPEAEWDLLARRPGCLLPESRHVAVDGDETVDFVLDRKSDTFGHRCETVAPAWADTDTAVPLQGDESSVSVPLPFPVSLYERHHRSVNVHSNGYLSFTSAVPNLSNVPIPSRDDPNAAIYPFWDDLVVDGQSSVRSGLAGAAPDRRFVVEWRDVAIFGTELRVSFQVVLYENGRILMQYRDLDQDALERGGSATVGIENDAGTVALQYSYHEPVLDNDTAILLRVPGTGMVRGVVTDANDHEPVARATVTVRQDGQPDRTVTTDAAGGYQVRVGVGAARLVVEKQHYVAAEADVVVDREDAVVERDFTLRTGRVTVDPERLELVVPAGQSRQRQLRLSNTGSAPAAWEIREGGGGALRPAAPLPPGQRTSGFRPGARDSRGVRAPAAAAAARAAARGAAPGEVLASWPTTGLQLGWGIGYESGNVWVSDAMGRRNASYTPDGAPRPENWPASWSADWAADMAYVPGRGLMCQVNVGGDHGVHCWDPRTGNVMESITGSFAWTAASQRGLAYRADDDTFYIGGWNEGVIYHIKGLSHPDRGAVIGRCSPADGAISGLAYNDAFQRLWVATNSDRDLMYAVNPDTCETTDTLAPPDRQPFTAGGLETDPTGNLWAISQGSPSTAYLIDSGMPNYTDVPWLTVTPAAGTLAPGQEATLTVTVDTTGLSPGLHSATVFLLSQSGRRPTIAVPVRVVVPAYQKGVNAGGGAHRDADADQWVPDQAYTAGGFGYLANQSRVVSTRRAIAGTAEQPLYQTLRQGAYEYRFDGVPNGVYEIELRFAELQNRRPDTRVFDVIAEGQLLVPALDVAGEVGTFTALDTRLTVRVTDGQLNVRLVDRRGGTIVNAIRVTHRPDRTG
ncbi:MAG TPA: S8 family serine peptidase [Pilimelia sp.]|nr:S8 family serine peptidase [Pilimelia sp.]